MSSCNPRYLSDFFSGAFRFSMDIYERNQQVDGGNFTELDGPKNGCSFIIEGKGFTNIYSVNTKSDLPVILTCKLGAIFM